jgi:23S rRNA pseudouridine1911/1915/1917 synthase
MHQDLSILLLDRHFVAVAKPARVPTASDASGDDTMLERVRLWHSERQEEGKKGYCVPIHFLDRPVSGVMVFGLSSKGASRLNEQFRARTMQKTYVAIVEGRPAMREGQLEHYLAKDRATNMTGIVSAKHPDGKRSVLRYKVLSTVGDLSWVLVQPETGRSHQIRVQLASLGTPIYGDLKYGAREAWDGHIALHAFRLELKHPISKESLIIEAPLSQRWAQLWKEPLPLTESVW